MKFRYAVIIVAAIGILVSGSLSPVWAQSDKEPTGFKNVTLWLNSEYDEPALLVMLEGKIVGVSPPTQVRFLVPTTAVMYSAGSMDAQGKYSGGPPDRKSSQIPGWDEISYQLQTETFRVEYYDPIISSQPDKKIAYQFRYLYPITSLRVFVQEPRKSTNFIVSPKGAKSVDGEGFTVHTYTYSNLSTDSPLYFDIAYTKSDPHPSLIIGTIGSTRSTNIPLILGIVAALGVAGLLVFQLLKTRPRLKPVKGHAARGVPGAAARRNVQNRHCNQCGNTVDSSDKFCSRCGSKINR